MRAWIEALDLRNMILACQDWGSLIGLRLVAEVPERFAGVALSNGGLPEGQPAPRAFATWRAFSRYSPFFPIGRIVNAGAKRALSDAEIAAYDAPFPTRASKVAARIRSEEHTSELQSLMRISYAVFCLKKKKKNSNIKRAY